MRSPRPPPLTGALTAALPRCRFLCGAAHKKHYGAGGGGGIGTRKIEIVGSHTVAVLSLAPSERSNPAGGACRLGPDWPT